MKTISFTEFRNNLKKYADLAEREKVIVSRGSGRAFYIVPVEQVEDSGYSEDFIKGINQAEEQIRKGLSTKVHSKTELNRFLEDL